MARSSLVCSIWQRYDFIPNIRCYQPEKSADPLFPKEVIINMIYNATKKTRKALNKLRKQALKKPKKAPTSRRGNSYVFECFSSFVFFM